MIIAIWRDIPEPEKGKDGQTSLAKDDSDTEDDDIIEVNKYSGWAYVGSHNFTPSAWGTLSGSGFRPTLNVRLSDTLLSLIYSRFSIQNTNYELGVVFPLKEEQAALDVACWERPPRKYDLGVDKPWVC